MADKESEKRKSPFADAGEIIRATGGIVAGIAAVAGAAATLGAVGAVAAVGVVGAGAVGYAVWRRKSGHAGGSGSPSGSRSYTLREKRDRCAADLISVRNGSHLPGAQFSVMKNKADLEKATSNFWSWHVQCSNVLKKWLGPVAADQFMRNVTAPPYDKAKARYVSPSAALTDSDLKTAFKMEQELTLYAKELDKLIGRVPSMGDDELRDPAN